MGGTTQQLRRSTPAPSGQASGGAWSRPLPAVLGALAVVVGILPVGWSAGAALAVAAMWLGARGLRRGPSWSGFGPARTGFVLGLIGLLMAVLSALLWFGS